MSTDTIHTALLDIARGGDDSIPLADGLSLVRPNDQLLAHRWDWVQGQGEMEAEAEATRYLLCEYPQWVQGEEWGAAPERGADSEAGSVSDACQHHRRLSDHVGGRGRTNACLTVPPGNSLNIGDHHQHIRGLTPG